MSLRGALQWCSAAARDKNTRVVERILHADSRSIMASRTPTSFILSLLVALSACGAEDKEEPEEVRVFERRRPTCEYFCGLAMDPDCGAQESSFAVEQECVDYCVSEDAEYWRLQDDDEDACADEFVALYECAGEGTCEDQSIIFNESTNAYLTPCHDALEELLDCYRMNPVQPAKFGYIRDSRAREVRIEPR